MHSSHLLLMVSEALEKTPSLLDSAVGKLTLPYISFAAVASPSTASYERLAPGMYCIGMLYHSSGHIHLRRPLLPFTYKLH